MAGRLGALLHVVTDAEESAPLQSGAGPGALKGRLGLRDAYSTIISNIIGSGIFSTPGLVYAAAGSPCASVLVWVTSGLVSMTGALCYVELATGHVDAAAEAAYFQKAFSRSVAFAFLVASFLALSSGSIAIEATVFARYLMALTGVESPVARPVIAVGLIGVLAHLNQKGVEQSAGIQHGLVAFKVAAVVMIIVVGRGRRIVSSAPTD